MWNNKHREGLKKKELKHRPKGLGVEFWMDRFSVKGQGGGLKKKEEEKRTNRGSKGIERTVSLEPVQSVKIITLDLGVGDTENNVGIPSLEVCGVGLWEVT